MRKISALLVLFSAFAAHANPIDVSRLVVGSSGDVWTLGYATVECMDLKTRTVTQQYGLIGPHPVKGVIAIVKRVTVLGPKLEAAADVATLVNFKSDDLDQSRSASCRIDMSALDAVTAIIMDSQKQY